MIIEISATVLVFSLALFILGDAFPKCEDSKMTIVVSLSLFGLSLFGLIILGNLCPVSSKSSYILPYQIIKTNNLTIAVSLDPVTCITSSKDGWIYHADNNTIKIKQSQGLNSYNKPIGPASYQLVINTQPTINRN